MSMTEINIQLLILLDPENLHSCYEAKIDRQIFRRCNNTQECRVHIVRQIDNAEWSKHIFLPGSDTELAEGPIPGKSDACFYLYSTGDQQLKSKNGQSKTLAFTKRFSVDELPFYLYSAGIELLFKLSRKPPDELCERERDSFVDMARQQLTALKHIFDQYESAQLSEEVTDR